MDTVGVRMPLLLCSNIMSLLDRCVITLLLITDISQSSQCSLCGCMALIPLSGKER